MSVATQEVAQSVLGMIPRKALAPPNASPSSLDRLYPHVDGPYKAHFSRDESLWHVFWDGWRDEPTARFETEEDAARAVHELAAQWRETAGRKVYFIGTACRLGERVKIGVAFDPKRRLSNLQTASPVPLQLLGTLPGGKDEEARLHRKFSRSRLSGEWFRITPSLKRLIEESNHGRRTDH